MSLLHVQTKILDEILLVRLKGELDHHTADQLREKVDQILVDHKAIRHLVLNCKQLTFMDSSGIGVLLGRYKEISRKKGQMVVCSVNPFIYRIMEMAGMFKIISVVVSEKEALTELGVA